MKEYTVHWSIDVSAETAREAAQQALEIQRCPDSIASVFVVNERDRLNFVTVDLLKD
jgi:hypothetical protein